MISRRTFLKTAVSAAPLFLPGYILGLENTVSPNNKIIMGGIGVNRRGSSDLRVLLQSPQVRFVADCDVRRDSRERIRDMVNSAYGNTDMVLYKEMEELLVRDDIDAVLIATGDRWHTMASITAAKFGKDIYCEKPLSLTVMQSAALEEAISRYGVVYQAGTQRRNIGNFMLAAEIAHSGKLGKLTEVHANTLWPAAAQSWLPAQPEPPADEIDWNRWLGPCPWRPYNEKYLTSWGGIYDFHGGGILEWGSHTIDLCQWAAQKDGTAPVRYEPQYNQNGAISGRVYAWYADGLKLVMRESGWLGLGTCSVRYVGEEGWVETGDSGRMAVSSDALRGELKYFGMPGTDPDTHIAEFIECVRSRRNPAANARNAAWSHIAAHCASISWQLGRAVEFDPEKLEFINDDDANRMRSRAQRPPFTL